MNQLLWCRRTFIATLAIPCILALGIYTDKCDVAWAIASVSVGLAAANSYEKKAAPTYQTK